MNLPLNKKSIGIVAASMVLTNLITYNFAVSSEVEKESESPTEYDHASGCSYSIKRLGGYNYIKPVLFVDSQCESDKLNPIKQSVASLIEDYKKTGDVNSASVYLKEYTGNEWVAINGDEKFMPGSLMKVPELIAFLKMEEANPGTVLNKKLLFNQVFIVDKHPRYLSKSIQLGQTYTVRELLNYMIMYSDNNATSLLFNNMDQKIFKKVFTDMGMPAPDMTAQNYPISAKDFSIFMRVLYNSSYLAEKNSEFATELLGKCNFKEGIVSSLPATVKVAHKFGESGDMNEHQLSESAIVYLNNNPYVLTVMVKGKEFKKLPAVVKQISAIVYQNMANNGVSS